MLKFLNCVLRESPLDTPFVPPRKNNPAAVAAAAPYVLAGFTTFLGGLLGVSSSSSANKANLQATRETNEANKDIAQKTNETQYQIAQEANAANYKQFQEQNEWNLEQWNRENEYNSPVNQAGRLRAAGINPAFANGMSAGNASPLTSAAASPAQQAQMQRAEMTAPQINPIDYSFVGSSVNAYLQAEMAKANVDETKSRTSYNNILTEFEARSMLSKLAREANEAKKGTVEYEQAKRNLDLFNDVYNYQVKQMRGTADQSEKQVQLLEEQVASAKISRDILSIDKSWRDKLNRASYNSLLAGISQAYSAARLNDQSAVESAARTAVENMRKEGMSIDNDTARKIQDSIIRKANDEATMTHDTAIMRNFERRNQKSGERLRRFTSAIPFVQGYRVP